MLRQRPMSPDRAPSIPPRQRPPPSHTPLPPLLRRKAGGLRCKSNSICWPPPQHRLSLLPTRRLQRRPPPAARMPVRHPARRLPEKPPDLLQKKRRQTRLLVKEPLQRNPHESCDSRVGSLWQQSATIGSLLLHPMFLSHPC